MEAIAVKIRAVAAAALAVALSAGLAGCNMISPQRTTMQYDASDGVNVDLGDVSLRNVILVTDSEGQQANLVYTAVNESNGDAKVEIKFDNSSVSANLSHDPANAMHQFGFGDGDLNVVNGEFKPGSTVTPVFTATYTDASGQSQTITVDNKAVPVLGDDEAKHILEEYQTLVPQPSASETPEATTDESASPTESATPAEEAPEQEAPADDEAPATE